jgi:hypothetical protein
MQGLADSSRGALSIIRPAQFRVAQRSLAKITPSTMHENIMTPPGYRIRLFIR